MPFTIPEERKTIEAINDPRPGDRFTEMFAFWLYVVKVTPSEVVTMEANPPCTFPEDGRIRIQTREEFLERLSYSNIPGTWVRLVDRDNDVSGWLESVSEKDGKGE